MTVIAFLATYPVHEGSLAEDVAAAIEALEDYDVSYETEPMGTTIEADDVDELLAAVGAAHKAIDGDRVETLLKIDDKRTSEEPASAKVEKVRDVLGRDPKKER
ncbi:MAG: MTH1187 family thiamine-binding protein [Halodesulfurarchaeum sp.]